MTRKPYTTGFSPLSLILKAMPTCRVRTVGIIAFVMVALTYVTAHELGMCKLADENGIIGMVVAVPRYHVCIYLMPLRNHC